MFGIRRATKEFCATLREISDEHSRLMAENESLRAENTKLRELVRALHECTAKTVPAKKCTDCILFDGEDGCLDLVRMRELGIEVEHD